MKMNDANEVLRLHVYNNSVWCGQNGVRAFNSDLSPDKFVRHQVFRDSKNVRLLGVPGNAKLILHIQETITKLSLKRKKYVQIGSPRICYRSCYLTNPIFVLQQMWQSDFSSKVLGGWHNLSASDYNNFLLIQSLVESDGLIGTKVEHAVRYHPVWGALSFLTDFDLHSAIHLICEIVDPRWFIDSSHPNRVQKLWKHLGVTPYHINKLINTGIVEEDEEDTLQKTKLVLQSWGGEKHAKGIDFEDPRNFLWRIYRNNGGGSVGLLKASKEFVQFIQLVWFQALARKPRKVFCPKLFFKHDYEAAAYQKHHASLLK